MSYLHALARRTLPAPLLHDFRHIDVSEEYGDGGRIYDRINIVRSRYYPSLSICFHPQQPLPGAQRGAIAYKLCRLLGYGIGTNASRDHDVVFKYTRETFSDPLSNDPFDGRPIINGDSIDISKRTVSATFEDVFGYGIGVDPTAYDGEIVVKSDLNSVHDGHLTDGPIAPADVRDSNAYQRAIDNTVPHKDAVLDYRVPIHGDDIPLVYLKYRPLKSRFSNKSAHAVIKEPSAIFSESEIEKIHRFARQMGIDYAELDVLRDKDGRIYVVDANPAPWGPPIGLTESDRALALVQLGMSFSQLIQGYAR